MKAEPAVEDLAPVKYPGRYPGSGMGRHRSIGRHAANVVFVAAAIIAMFWRVFFLGESLVDVATLNNQLPWGHSAAQIDYPYNRRDLTDTYATREYFVAQSYRDREFPLWNPYTMAGHPIYADGVTRTLSPFLVFYRFFDVPLGYSLARITELMLAAFFIYLFLIGIGTCGNGALAGALVFAFSSHSMLHLTGLGWWGGLMWLPLIFLFADRAIRCGSYTYALVAGVCLAAQFFCGYLPNQIYYLGAIGLYYLFFVFRRSGGSAVPRLDNKSEVGNRSDVGDQSVSVRAQREGLRRRLLGMMVVTVASGLLLSATQWVPALELLSNSNRKIVGAELGYVYLPPWYAATLFFPNLFGTAYDARMLNLFTGLGVSHDHILYLGIAALAPLGFSLFWLRSTAGGSTEGVNDEGGLIAGPGRRVPVSVRDRVVFFVLLSALSLVIMMAAPVYVPITRFIPVLQVIRVAVRAGVLFLFGATALTAFGTDLLLQAGVDMRRRFARLATKVCVWTGVCTLAAVIGSYMISAAGWTVEPGERGKLAFIRRAALALSEQFTPPSASIMLSLGLLLALAMLLRALAEKRAAGGAFPVCLVGLLIVDLFWNSAQFNHSFDRSRVFPRTEITDLLKSLPPGRVLVVPSDLETNRRVSSETRHKIIAPPNTLLAYQISTVTGKNQQFPRWYREFASLVEPQNNLSHVVFDQYRSRYLDLLNVRYVMTYDDAKLQGEYRLLASADGVSLYESLTAMPRAFFATGVVEARDHSDAVKALAAESSGSRGTAIVETSGVPASEREKLAALTFDQGHSTGSEPEPEMSLAPPIATITEDRRNKVMIQAENQYDGLLVLSDNYYPGWRAFVDGSPAEVFRANCTMRAVRVPAGRHVVSFAFMPVAFFGSLYLSLATAALTLSIVVAATFRHRRGTSHAIR